MAAGKRTLTLKKPVHTIGAFDNDARTTTAGDREAYLKRQGCRMIELDDFHPDTLGTFAFVSPQGGETVLDSDTFEGALYEACNLAKDW